MASNKLVEVFASFDQFSINEKTLPPEGKSLLFASNRFKGSPGEYSGEPAIVGRTAFKKHFDKFTRGFFNGVREIFLPWKPKAPPSTRKQSQRLQGSLFWRGTDKLR